MITNDQKVRILEFAMKAFDGDLTPSESKELEGAISSSKALAGYYSSCIKMHLCMVELETSRRMVEGSVSAISDPELWQMMALHEKTAPQIELPRQQRKKELIEKVIYPPRQSRKLSKFGFFVLVNTAAMLFVILFLRFAPFSRYGTEVAVLEDQINAKWASPDALAVGSPLRTDQTPLKLESGVVKIRYEGVEVMIEGPALFEVERSGLYFEYGRLYSRVSDSGLGFTVQTPTSRFVDLGTEFGLQAEINGSSELHVIKGKVQLFTGSQGHTRTGQIVTENNAVRYNANNGMVNALSAEKEIFVRQINSKTGVLWRGQKHVDLADITGGGNGFGTGRRNAGLDPVSGEITGISQADVNRKAVNDYHRVQLNPCIDGVFVPNGQTKQVISSLGHVFAECPATQGNYYTEISSAPRIIDRSEVVLGGVNYSREDISSLFIHANLGITYDLQAIRSQLAGAKITRFRSTIGICDSSRRPCNADFWILVDGQLRYSRPKVQQKGILDTVEIELPENARFLTLVTTDGGDPEAGTYMGGIVTSMDSDWCLFAQPVLVLE